MKSLLLALLLTAGCTAPANIFRIDARITDPGQREAVAHAFEFWNSTNVTEPVDYMFDVDVGPWKNRRTVRLVENREDLNFLLWARTQANLPTPSTLGGFDVQLIGADHVSEILFVDTMHFEDRIAEAKAIGAYDVLYFWQDPMKAFMMTIRHELGHHFDLEHVADPIAIMAPTLGTDTMNCLRPDDVSQLRYHIDGIRQLPDGMCP